MLSHTVRRNRVCQRVCPRRQPPQALCSALLRLVSRPQHRATRPALGGALPVPGRPARRPGPAGGRRPGRRPAAPPRSARAATAAAAAAAPTAQPGCSAPRRNPSWAQRSALRACSLLESHARPLPIGLEDPRWPTHATCFEGAARGGPRCSPCSRQLRDPARHGRAPLRTGCVRRARLGNCPLQHACTASAHQSPHSLAPVVASLPTPTSVRHPRCANTRQCLTPGSPPPRVRRGPRPAPSAARPRSPGAACPATARAWAARANCGAPRPPRARACRPR